MKQREISAYETMQKETTKTNAVIRLAEYWNIYQSEIVSFGDDTMDIELNAYTGVGVAVNNAIKEVKSVADYICDTNDNDGVAKWIVERILA